jgi:AcrR family transcriptional regulator
MMHNSAPSPRALKKRDQILDTALKVFAREGFAETDVQVIADLAKVGKGTVYRHFGNKRELFLATARHSVEKLSEFLREQVKEGSSSVQILREIATSYARYFELHPESVEIMIQERASFREQVFPTHLMHRAETRNEFETFLNQAMAAGELRQVDVADVTNAFADLLYGSVVSGCLEGAKGSLLQRVDRAIDIFLHGLLPTAQVS